MTTNESIICPSDMIGRSRRDKERLPEKGALWRADVDCSSESLHRRGYCGARGFQEPSLYRLRSQSSSVVQRLKACFICANTGCSYVGAPK